MQRWNIKLYFLLFIPAVKDTVGLATARGYVIAAYTANSNTTKDNNHHN